MFFSMLIVLKCVGLLMLLVTHCISFISSNKTVMYTVYLILTTRHDLLASPVFSVLTTVVLVPGTTWLCHIRVCTLISVTIVT